MKQTKKMLCIIIAIVMMLSCMTVGVNAYSANYAYANGYDKANFPTFSKEQAASAILQGIDNAMNNDTKIYIDILDYTVEVKSVDTLFNFLHDIYELPAYKEYSQYFDIDLGDIDSVDRTIPNNTEIRRTSKTISDFQMLGYVLDFCNVNYNVLSKLVDGTFDLGLLSTGIDESTDFLSLVKTGDLRTYTMKTLCTEWFGFYSDAMKSSTFDSIIQDFLNNKCISYVVDQFAGSDGSNPVANFLKIKKGTDGRCLENIGILDYCTSLTPEQLDITKVPFALWVKNIIKSLLNDYVAPRLGYYVLKVLGINPTNVSADTKYIDLAIEILAKRDASFGIAQNASRATAVKTFLKARGVANPSAPTPIAKTNALVDYAIKVTLPELIHMEKQKDGSSTLYVDDIILDNLEMIMIVGVGVVALNHDRILKGLPRSLENAIIRNSNDEGSLEYIAKRAYVKYKDFDITSPFDFNQEAMSFLVDIAKDYAPAYDFEAMIENKQLNPSESDYVKVLSVIIESFCVRELGMDPVTKVGKMPSTAKLCSAIFRHLFKGFESFFNPYKSEEDYEKNKNSTWYLVYNTLNQWIPITKIFVGVEDSPAGLKDLVINKILGRARANDFKSICSLIGIYPGSELEKPLSQILANTIARVVNGLFKLDNENDSDKSSNAEQCALIVPYTYTTLEELVANKNTNGVNNGTGIQNSLKMILKNLYRLKAGGQLSFYDNGLVNLAIITRMIKPESCTKLNQYMRLNWRTCTGSELEELYNSVAPKGVKGVIYDNANRRYFSMIDYKPMEYRDFINALEKAETLINKYKSGVVEQGTVYGRAYSRLNKAKELLDQNKWKSDNTQLLKLYNKVSSLSFKDENGEQLYTEGTWKPFERARNFAVKVLGEYNADANAVNQSRINESRRQLEKAYDGLLEWLGMADYAQLDAEIERANNLNYPATFTDESVAAVVEAYKEAINLPRDYDAYSQDIVDACYNKLHDAISALENAVYISFYNYGELKQYNDFRNDYIYGFDSSFWCTDEKDGWGDDFDTYFGSTYGMPIGGNGFGFVATATELGSGTGTKVQILDDPYIDNPTVKGEYTVVIFGDLNGDGYVDGMDAVESATYASGMIDSSADNYNLYTYAGDLNFDGSIDDSDVATLVGAGLFTETVNQNPTEVVDAQITFAELLAASC